MHIMSIKALGGEITILKMCEERICEFLLSRLFEEKEKIASLTVISAAVEQLGGQVAALG